MLKTVLIILTVSVLMPGKVFAMRARISSDISVVIAGNRKRLDNNTRKLLKNIDSVTNLLAKFYTKDDRIPCRIFYSENRLQSRLKVKTKRVCKLTLPYGVDINNSIPLQAKLVNIILLLKLNISPDRCYRKVPKWLTAALWHKVKRKTEIKPVMGPVTYPVMHYLTVNSSIPGIMKFVDFPLRTKDGPLYLFYAEGCEILLNFITSSKGLIRNKLKEYITASINDPKARMKNFNMYINRYIDEKYEHKKSIMGTLVNNSLVDHLFYHFFKDKTVTYFMPGNAAYAKVLLAENCSNVPYKIKTGEVELKKKKSRIGPAPLPVPKSIKQFKKMAQEINEQEGNSPTDKVKKDRETEQNIENELVQQEIVKKDETTGIVLALKRVTLNQLPTVWKQVYNKNEVIFILKKRFSAMRYSLPVAYNRAFVHFSNAFDELQQSDTDDFSEEFKLGKIKFQECRMREKKLESYLRRAEDNYIPPGRRFQYLHEAKAVIKTREQKVWSNLIDYLDNVEKRYSE